MPIKQHNPHNPLPHIPPLTNKLKPQHLGHHKPCMDKLLTRCKEALIQVRALLIQVCPLFCGCYFDKSLTSILAPSIEEQWANYYAQLEVYNAELAAYNAAVAVEPPPLPPIEIYC